MGGNQYTSEFLSAMRLRGDERLDDFIRGAFSDPDRKAALYQWLQQLTSNISFAQLPQENQQYDFITNSQNLPDWADKKLMANGAAFFVKHAEQIMQLLGLLSLPYCYAAADGAMVLYLSQRLKNDSGKRLTDTAEFICDVMSPDAFEPQGKGFASILKIRLTHAAARFYTLKGGKWDDNLGFPVNQEDMAGTNLAFSLIVIRGLRKLGYSISYNEQQAFLHLWNVIGHLLGLNKDLVPQNGKAANALELAIRKRHFKPSEQGRELTKALLAYLEIATPANVSTKQTISLMRYLLGEEVSDLLDIPAIDVPRYLPFVLQIRRNLPTGMI